MPLRLDTVPTSAGPLAIHKSTARDIYDTARTRTDANYASTGAPGDRPFDVLMWNEDGKVIETSIANFAVYLRGSELLSAAPNWNGTPQELERGAFVTPGLCHGLIAGVMRTELLAKGELVEGTIVKEDVLRYAKVWIMIRPATLEANFFTEPYLLPYDLLQRCSGGLQRLSHG